jgi:predicted ATPase
VAVELAALAALAALTADETVLPAIARSLGMREQPGELLSATIARFLREKSLLLVLDNFEHVLPVAVRIAELLRACPKLKVLATSRSRSTSKVNRRCRCRRWRSPWHPLPPLEQLTQYDAVRLFLERAQAVKPDFKVTGETAAAVAEICARLDGLPLAIELAAARVKLLPPAALLTRLDHRLNLLVGGPRDQTPRQQTLRATIDWSYHLLTLEQQAVFRRLGVFTGGWTLQAAEAVCNTAADSSQLQALDILAVLGVLVDQSLLHQEAGVDGEARFDMLETIREYAMWRLADEAEAVNAQRTHVFIAIGEQAAPELIAGAQHARWLHMLEAEEDNLRAALRWCLEVGDIERGLRLGGAVWRYWFMQGSLSQSREWLHTLLRLVRSPGHSAFRARALNAAGSLANQQGDFLGAQALSSEALGLARELNEPKLIASALSNLGLLAVRRGDYTTGLTLVEEAVGIERVGRARREQSVGLNMAGGLLAYLGDYATARARYAESMECCRELGDKTGMADALSRQGFAALAERDVVDAQGLCESALRLAREEGNGGAIAWALLNLALVRLTQQDCAAARELCSESIRLGDDTDEAQARLALGMELMASIATEAGDGLRALHLFGAAAAVSTTRGTRFNLFDRILRGRLALRSGACDWRTGCGRGHLKGPRFWAGAGQGSGVGESSLEALTE